MIRYVTSCDAQRICDIYNYYVLNTAVTFETEAVGADDMGSRIANISDKYPYYVYEEEGQVVGYCYLSTWNGRCAYRTTAEVSIYLDNVHQGKGIGTKLMNHLLENIDPKKTHTLIAGIALPNDSSVALHEKYGFRQISHFREIGHKFDQWRDVGHWQLIL